MSNDGDLNNNTNKVQLQRNLVNSAMLRENTG